nr:MAG TPA: hypothetical protein [Caudoviricetes sp.]
MELLLHLLHQYHIVMKSFGALGLVEVRTVS